MLIKTDFIFFIIISVFIVPKLFGQSTDFRISVIEDKHKNTRPEVVLPLLKASKDTIENISIPTYSSSIYWFLISPEKNDFDLLIFENQTVKWIEIWRVKENKISIDGITRLNAHLPSFQIDEYKGEDLLIRCEFSDITTFKVAFEHTSRSAYQDPINFSSVTLAFQGIIVGLIFYNLSICVFLKNKMLIYFTLYCIFYVLSSITMSGILSLFSLEIVTEYLSLFGASTIIFSGIFLTTFLDAKHFAPILTRLLYIILTFIFFVAILSYYNRSFLEGLDLFFIFGVLIQITILVKGVILGQESALVHLLSSLGAAGGLFVSISANYRLLPLNLITQNSLNIGANIQMMILSIGIGYRMNKIKQQMIDKVLLLNTELETKVEEKTRDIKSMVESMQQGILNITINEDQIIILPGYSKFLPKLLKTSKNLDNVDFIETLFSKSNLSTDEVDQIRNVLFVSIQGDLEFDLNSHLLPREFCIKRAHFEIDWTPVVNDMKVIEKILVTIRDVTKIKELEKESYTKTDELDIISSILNMKKTNFERFIESIKSLVLESKNLIDSTENITSNVVKDLFINMHTIKGSSRTHGFKKIADTAHTCENYYSAINRQITEPKKDKLIADLSDLELGIHQIQEISSKIYQNIDDPLNYPLDKEYLNKFINKIEKEVGKESSNFPNQVLYEIYQYFLDKQYYKLNEIVNSVFMSSHHLAHQMGKPPPIIEKNNLEKYLINPQAAVALEKALVHLMRNSLDHGIESPEIRHQKGKNTHGSILLSAKEKDNTLILTVQDDGQGLNISKIRSILSERKIFPKTTYDTANHIFDENFSTAQTVTEISGRGVGMSSIKKFLEEIDCSITLLIGNESSEGYVSLAFKITFKNYRTLSDTASIAKAV